jgi:hypothetical protein
LPYAFVCGALAKPSNVGSAPHVVGYRPFRNVPPRPRRRNLCPRTGVSSVVSSPSTRIQGRAMPARVVEILDG